jgi:site-specific DNA-methyltransferase (adenine-specific)
MTYINRFIDKTICGDAQEILKKIPDNCIDAVVTDPPYGLSFMSRPWDSLKSDHGNLQHKFQNWCESWAREALRVLKPGGHLLAFGASRTYHRLVCGIENAGFEIRDSIHWVNANGFPKSLDISKAIDKAAGKTRKVIMRKKHTAGIGVTRFGQAESAEYVYSLPASSLAKRWQGWGTALKPAHEAICVARKPLSEPTAMANVLKYGVGAINIDACRIGLAGPSEATRVGRKTSGTANNATKKDCQSNYRAQQTTGSRLGRWPSNFILSHISADENGEGGCRYAGNGRVKNTAGNITKGGIRRNKVYGSDRKPRGSWKAYGDSEGYERIASYVCAENCPVAELDRQGNASRYFKVIDLRASFIYRSKPSTSEKNLGCDNLFWRCDSSRPSGFAPISRSEWERLGEEEARIRRNTGKPVSLRGQGNIHCTVKGVALMEYLIRLVTPPDGVVLDPFAGSGTTGVAAALGGWRFILIEQDPDYARIAKARIRYASTKD